MFKKSLLAVAVLGTAAGFACAADVTLYGVVDTGLLYNSNKVTINGTEAADTKTFGLESGVSAASRFGLKGTEDLGNGLKVGFTLENGFKADDGSLDNGDRLFGREASLTVSGDFGALSMGRMGGIGSAAGTYDVVFATADAFDGGDNAIFGLQTSDRFDNMITYQTPKFAGVQGTFQYSFKQNNKEEGDYREGSAATDRYASAALTGEFGALNTVLGYEFFNWASNDGKPNTAEDIDDGHVVYLGGNYDCGFAKTFVMAQYFKGMDFGNLLQNTDLITDAEEAQGELNGSMKGYGLHLGTIVPVAGGDFTVGAYYVDATHEDGYFAKAGAAAAIDSDVKYYGLAAKYEYPLSKRTSVYTGAGYSQTKVDNADGLNAKEKNSQAYVGLTHKF